MLGTPAPVLLLAILQCIVQGAYSQTRVKCIPGKTQFPNPDDRHSFYKCDAGGTPILFQCPPGTWFNLSLEVCDWDTGSGGSGGSSSQTGGNTGQTATGGGSNQGSGGNNSQQGGSGNNESSGWNSSGNNNEGGDSWPPNKAPAFATGEGVGDKNKINLLYLKSERGPNQLGYPIKINKIPICREYNAPFECPIVIVKYNGKHLKGEIQGIRSLISPYIQKNGQDEVGYYGFQKAKEKAKNIVRSYNETLLSILHSSDISNNNKILSIIYDLLEFQLNRSKTDIFSGSSLGQADTIYSELGAQNIKGNNSIETPIIREKICPNDLFLFPSFPNECILNFIKKRPRGTGRRSGYGYGGGGYGVVYGFPYSYSYSYGSGGGYGYGNSNSVYSGGNWWSQPASRPETRPPTASGNNSNNNSSWNSVRPTANARCDPRGPLFYRNTDDCSTFFTCNQGRMVLTSCPRRMYYNPDTARCEDFIPSGCRVVNHDVQDATPINEPGNDDVWQYRRFGRK